MIDVLLLVTAALNAGLTSVELGNLFLYWGTDRQLRHTVMLAAHSLAFAVAMLLWLER